MATYNISEKQAGVRLLLANITYWMAAGAYSPFLSAYYTSIGLTGSQIGMLLAIQPIAAIAIQPLWARLSDRTGKRKLVLMCLVAASGLAALLYYIDTTFLTLLGATLIFASFYSALLPLCDALVIESAAFYHRDFAKIRMGGTLGYAFVVFIIGFYLSGHPRHMFVIFTMLTAVFSVFVWLLPVTTRPGEQPKEKKEDGRIFRSNEALFVLAFAFVSQIGLGVSGSLMGRYVVELGHDQSIVGILSCISALSEVPILLVAKKLVDRFGEIRILFFSSLMMVLRIYLTGLGLIPTMVVGQLLQSVTYMTVYFCCTTYISKNVFPGKQSQGQSVLTMVQTGFAAVLANIGGGILSDQLGTRGAYMLAAVLILALSLMMSLIYWAYHKKALDKKS